MSNEKSTVYCDCKYIPIPGTERDGIYQVEPGKEYQAIFTRGYIRRTLGRGKKGHQYNDSIERATPRKRRVDEDLIEPIPDDAKISAHTTMDGGMPFVRNGSMQFTDMSAYGRMFLLKVKHDL